MQCNQSSLRPEVKAHLTTLRLLLELHEEKVRDLDAALRFSSSVEVNAARQAIEKVKSDIETKYLELWLRIPENG